MNQAGFGTPKLIFCEEREALALQGQLNYTKEHLSCLIFIHLNISKCEQNFEKSERIWKQENMQWIKRQRGKSDVWAFQDFNGLKSIDIKTNSTYIR